MLLNVTELFGFMASTLSKYFIASEKLPWLESASPLASRAITLFGSTASVLSTNSTASEKLYNLDNALLS
jgi:hypothetical protein